jgi:hypothetical protein
MAEDIIFHLGYPKTATKYMQRGLFRNVGALGNDSCLPGARSAELALRQAVCYEHPRIWSQSAGRDLFEQIQVLAGERRPILYSSEFWLHGPSCFHVPTERALLPEQYTHLATEHLASIKKHLWGDRGAVRALITVRSQAKWLGSRYAQMSDRRRQAGQSDFQDLVRRTLLDNSPAGWRFLDYHALQDELSAVLGAENVLMLVYEDIGSPGFWERVEKWCGYPLKAFGNSANKRHNVRSVGEDAWLTRPHHWMVQSEPVLWADRLTRRVMGWSVRNALKRVQHRCMRKEVIRLTPEVKASVLGVFSESNRKLAVKLRCDLHAWEYY